LENIKAKLYEEFQKLDAKKGTGLLNITHFESSKKLFSLKNNLFFSRNPQNQRYHLESKRQEISS